jgi:negative regulator of sigma E activity
MPTDETLSAFLDGELPPADMDTVREQVRRQPELAARLAELSLVDKLVRAQASRIDNVPMPANVLAMLGADAAAQPRSNVVPFPAQLVRRWTMPLALAASLVLAVGVVLWRDQAPEGDSQMAYAALLETASSGNEITVMDAKGGAKFVATFSYRNHDDRWCRQFRWREDGRDTSGIACRQDNGKWQLEHSVESVAGNDSEYRVATKPESVELDKWLDADMKGQAIDATAEAALLTNHWQR